MKKNLFLALNILFSMIVYSQFPTPGSEGFENTNGANLAVPITPSPWSLGTGAIGNQWAVFDNGVGLSNRWGVTSVTNNVYAGLNSAYIQGEPIGINNISEDYLATPLLNIPSNCILSFWTKSNFTNNESEYSIKVNTNSSSNSQTNITNYNTTVITWSDINLNPSSNGFVKKEINLSAYAGQQIYIAFVKKHIQSISNYLANDWIIDDINIDSQPCPVITNLYVNNTTFTSAVLNWTDNLSTNWEIYVSPAGSPAPQLSNGGIVTASNPFIITGLNPNECYDFYIRSNFSCPWSGPSSYCTNSCQINGTCNDRLELIAFIDSNNNGIKDSGELPFTNGNYTYEINNNGIILNGNSNSNSYLIFDSNPNNSYNLGFNINPNFSNYFNSTSNFSNITIPSGGGIHTYYFPITILQPLSDIEISLFPDVPPRPGFTYQNSILYKNNGSQTINGTVTFVNNPLVTITSISQTSTTSTSNGFTYNFTNLAPNEERWFTVTMQVPTIPTVNLGDLITNSVSITPLTGDVFPNDNQMSLSQIVVGSYDPNDKTEAHGGKIDIDDFTSNDYLTYTIQFENTGTANAEFVRVEDFLDATLNPSSIEMLDSSHAYNMRRIGNQLIWNFYDINLPPTSINPTGSHGFIQFKIKPTAGFALGDIIPNKAFIYFDYNPPIITNEFQTEFVQSLKTTDFDSSNFVLYPNPTNSNITISLLNSTEAINSIEIHDLLGKKIKEVLNSSSNDVNIDVSDLSKGVYLVQITTQSDLKITKKLIIK